MNAKLTATAAALLCALSQPLALAQSTEAPQEPSTQEAVDVVEESSAVETTVVADDTLAIAEETVTAEVELMVDSETGEIIIEEDESATLADEQVIEVIVDGEEMPTSEQLDDVIAELEAEDAAQDDQNVELELEVEQVSDDVEPTIDEGLDEGLDEVIEQSSDNITGEQAEQEFIESSQEVVAEDDASETFDESSAIDETDMPETVSENQAAPYHFERPMSTDGDINIPVLADAKVFAEFIDALPAVVNYYTYATEQEVIDFYSQSYGEPISQERKRGRLTVSYYLDNISTRVVISEQNQYRQVDVIQENAL